MGSSFMGTNVQEATLSGKKEEKGAPSVEPREMKRERMAECLSGLMFIFGDLYLCFTFLW